MSFFTTLLTAWLALQQAPEPGIYRATFQAPDGLVLRYTVSVPPGYDGSEPHPLLLALHPGDPFPWAGGAFMEEMVLPALFYQTDAFIIAPDSPAGSWVDPASERAVVTLVRRIMDDVAVDPERVVVTGFSMGGRGAWRLSSRHPDLFTGAIVMAGSTNGTPVQDLATMPTYVIHSRTDDVVPFLPAETTMRELRRLGRIVSFEPIDEAGHFDLEAYIEPLQRGMRWMVNRWSE